MVALSAQLYAEARLQQTVSPQVVLQSRILELSAHDLRERVQSELDENPALEMLEDVDYLPAPVIRASAIGDFYSTLDNFHAPQTLADDLRLQLARTSGPLRPICDYLIECLDPRGFLDAEPAEVAAAVHASESQVEAAIEVLQSLEPAGVGARGLKECLLLQVKRFPTDFVPPRTVDFIEASLARRSATVGPAQVATLLRLSDAELSAIVTFVARELHMWPADAFRDGQEEDEAPQTILPDAAVDWEGDELRVRVVQSWSRNLQVDAAWARLDGQMRQADCTRVTADRMTECVQRARAFIDHLSRREVMLKRVTEAIVVHQREFFEHGRQALAPLTRKEIAAELGVHECTVSRITAGKYVRLPNMQLVSYDFFFDSSQSAKSVLQSLIAQELPQRPLSDAALADRLQAAGYDLARRTVAKYRDQLGIPPMCQRRGAARGH
jgi:RNA polymerase sigma-54 factor